MTYFSFGVSKHEVLNAQPRRRSKVLLRKITHLKKDTGNVALFTCQFHFYIRTSFHKKKLTFSLLNAMLKMVASNFGTSIHILSESIKKISKAAKTAIRVYDVWGDGNRCEAAESHQRSPLPQSLHHE